MLQSFLGVIDSISEDGVVRFHGRPGGYHIPARPADIARVLRDGHRGGSRVEVTYDDRSFVIEDAVAR